VESVFGATEESNPLVRATAWHKGMFVCPKALRQVQISEPNRVSFSADPLFSSKTKISQCHSGLVHSLCYPDHTPSTRVRACELDSEPPAGISRQCLEVRAGVESPGERHGCAGVCVCVCGCVCACVVECGVFFCTDTIFCPRSEKSKRWRQQPVHSRRGDSHSNTALGHSRPVATRSIEARAEHKPQLHTRARRVIVSGRVSRICTSQPKISNTPRTYLSKASEKKPPCCPRSTKQRSWD
jgi:hypothetical protein